MVSTNLKLGLVHRVRWGIMVRGRRRVEGYLLAFGAVHLISLESLRLDRKRLHKPGEGAWALYYWQETNRVVVLFPLLGKKGISKRPSQ